MPESWPYRKDAFHDEAGASMIVKLTIEQIPVSIKQGRHANDMADVHAITAQVAFFPINA